MKHAEAILENRCRLFARQKGIIATKLEKNAHKGIPDDIFILPTGKAFFVEFKRDARAYVRLEQKIWQERFKNCIFFCHSFEAFEQILDNQLNTID